MRRPQEITTQFIAILDQHLLDIVSGKTDQYLEIREMAEKLHIHPTHLSNTIKETTGISPCKICDQRTVEMAKKLLGNRTSTISSVAYRLTYEPAHFAKYFKKHTGLTPTQFRNSVI